MEVGETIKWHCDWRIRKFSAEDTARLTLDLGRAPLGEDFEAFDVAPYEDNRVLENLVTTLGLGRLTSLMIGAGGQAPTNTSARIGVGDGSGTAAVGDTDLSAAAGSTHRYFQPMDASFPTQAAGVMTFQATFASANGNFAWNEFGIDVGTPTVTGGTTVAALLLNHKTSISQGTKASSQTWVAAATITLA